MSRISPLIIQTARNRELSPLAKASAKNLQLLHPDWEYRFFDDTDIRRFVAQEFPQYLPTFDAFPRSIQRIDFFRYLAVFRLGGFYFDLDVLLSENLNPLVDHHAVFPFEELTLNRYLRRQYKMDWEIGNYAFGTAPGNPFLHAVIENCARSLREPAWVTPMMEGIPKMFHREFSVLNTTGPGVVTRTLAENPAIAGNVHVLFPKDVCDTQYWHQFGTFGIHLMDGSWRSKGGFIYRRLAGWWETRAKSKLINVSRALGPNRQVRFETGI